MSGLEQALFDRSRQQHHDGEPTTSARQIAEALFAPKRSPTPEPMGEDTPPSGVSVRKPRVLTISSITPIHHGKPAAPSSPKEPVTPEIPRSQFARIRAWAQYGMTAGQVAEVYGVAVGEIKSILGKGRQSPAERV
jgi:hypothetical protein